MYYVYVLQSLKDGKTYVGYTNDFERRFGEHNSGKSKSTKHRIPFKLLFKEEFINNKQAKDRELWWKSGVGRRKLKEYFGKLNDYDTYNDFYVWIYTRNFVGNVLCKDY